MIEKPLVAAADGRGWMVFLILASSAFSPLRTWANAAEPVNPLTIAFAFAVIAGIGLIIWMVLIRLGLEPLGASYATAVLLLALTNTGALVERYAQGHVLLTLGSILSAALVYRLRQLPPLRLLISWGAFVAIGLPLASLIPWSSTGTSGDIDVNADLTIPAMVATPDIVVIVLDAYAGAGVLGDLYDYDNAPFLDRLEALGFETDEPTLANYARTAFSISSFLQLDYMGGETSITTSDLDPLWGVLGGENNLVSALEEHGYRHVYVESGWQGTTCAASVDVCVGARWPDETFHDVAFRSVLRGLPGYELGRPFTEGAIHALDWMERELPRYLGDDRPDVVFVHVLAPHPPLFLDGTCRPNWREGKPGYAIGGTDESDAELADTPALYIGQLECVNSVLLEVAASLPPDDVAVMFGDHGPDSLGQLFTPGEQWSDAQRRERFSVFYAARVPGCDMSSIESVVNLGRRMMSCLGNTELSDLDTRVYDMHRGAGGSRITELEPPEL